MKVVGNDSAARRNRVAKTNQLGGHIIIKPPGARDWPAFQAAVRRSRALHHPWVTPPNTRKKFEAYVRRAVSDSHHGFLVVHRESDEIIGVINLGNIIRGPLQGAYVGYYAFAPHAGKGLMCEGIQLVLKHAFQKLRLHRLEANIQPGNQASIRLARRCGFVHEGFSRRYLKVNGRWKDHERWAILAENMPHKSK